MGRLPDRSLLPGSDHFAPFNRASLSALGDFLPRRRQLRRRRCLLASGASARRGTWPRGHALDRRHCNARVYRTCARSSARRPGRTSRSRSALERCAPRPLPRAGCRHRGLRLRLDRRLLRGHGAHAASAGVDQPRISVGGILGGKRACLPSPHPRLPLTCWFYFPGFTAHTGGLLRENGLRAARVAFGEDPGAREALWRAIGVEPASSALTISLFCYANKALPALLDAWAEGDEPIVCVVPQGVAQAELDRWTGGAIPHPGKPAVSWSPYACRRELRRTGRLRSPVMGVRPEFCSRRGLAGAGAVGGEASGLAHLPPSRRRAYVEARCVAGPIRGWTGIRSRSRPAGVLAGMEFRSPRNGGRCLAILRAVLPELNGHARVRANALARQTDLAKGPVIFCENRL